MLTGLRSIRATSKATLPCPSITAVSELRSGFNYNRQKIYTFLTIKKMAKMIKNDFLSMINSTLDMTFLAIKSEGL